MTIRKRERNEIDFDAEDHRIAGEILDEIGREFPPPPPLPRGGPRGPDVGRPPRQPYVPPSRR